MNATHQRTKICLLLISCIALSSISITRADVAGLDDSLWPTTTAGRRAKAFFEAYELGSADAFRRFSQEHRNPSTLKGKAIEKFVAEALKVRRMVGPLEAVEIKSVSDLKISVTTHANTVGVWLRFDVKLESRPPHFWTEIVGRPTKPLRATSKTYDAGNGLGVLAKEVRKDIGAPALAAAIARSSGVIERIEIGNRSATGADPIQPGDRFHIGSIGKSFTATTIAALIERGEVGWDLTIGTALPDIDMKPVYRNATLAQLVRHRGGIRPIPSGGEFELGFDARGRSPLEGRAALVAQVLSEDPAAPIGSRKIYSNAGYVVAAHMIELASNSTWEDLVAESVFKPWGLESAEVGWPATKLRTAQPLGHFGAPSKLRVQGVGQHGLGDIDFAVFLAPAGHISCSISDLARYGRIHMQGLRGIDGPLRAETIRELHRPGPPSGNGSLYAAGWKIQKNKDGSPKHSHAGSGGTFYAVVTIYPESDLVVAIATNIGIHASDFLNAMTDAIYARYDAAAATP